MSRAGVVEAFLAFVWAVWSSAVPDPSPRQAPDSVAVRSVATGILAADNARNLARLLSFYADSAMLLPPNQRPVMGRAAIRPHYAALFRDFDPAIEGQIDELVVTGDRAYVRGRNRGMLRGRHGNADRVLDDVYLMILERRAGSWRIARLMWHRASAPPTPDQQAVPGADRTTSEPPCDLAGYHQFDFWLGEWRVTGADGRLAGYNRIERMLGGCALHESWTARDGSRGESFSSYDRWADRWHQTWVDDQGLLLQLDGGLTHGAMVLEGDRASPGGGQVRHRITWTPSTRETVRQHWQRSRDGGRTWATVFDGIYRHPTPP